MDFFRLAVDFGPELVLGSGGSNRIRSAIKQVIVNKFIKNMNLEEAIQAQRIYLEENISIKIFSFCPHNVRIQ